MNGYGFYDIEVTAMNQNDVNSGDDAGNDFTSATSISPGSYFNCYLQNEDFDDIYSMTLTGNGTRVWVNITVPGAYQIDLYLYDALQMQMASVSVSSGTNGVDHVFKTAQVVYIHAELWSGYGNYDLEVVVIPQNDINSGDDAGNDFASATPIIPGSYSNCFLKDEDDIDCYSLTLTAAGQTVYVNVTVPTSQNFDIYLFEEADLGISVEEDSGTGLLQMEHTFETAQIVYIKVVRQSGSEGFYDLEVSVLSQDDVNSGGDAGNDFASATPITSGAYTNCFLKDEDNIDCYSLTLTAAGQTVYVNVTVPTLQNFEIYLFEEADLGISVEEDSGTGLLQMEHTFETAQTVYIKVLIQSGSEGFYDLEVSAPTTPPDDTSPVITHTPITTGNAGQTINITATITDVETGVQSATLYYRETGTTQYTSLIMTKNGDIYVGVIPSQAVTTDGVQYYIEATDGTNNATNPEINPITNPYAITVIPISAPTGLTATPGDANVSLTWNSVADASGYNVYRSLSSTGGYTLINTVLVTATSYEDITVTNDEKYYYYVKSVDSNGEESLASSIVNATPSSIILPAPTGLAATPGDAKVTLTWNAVAGASGYNISRSLSSTGGYTQINTVLVTATSYEDTTVTNDVKYYYYVKAVDSNGEESLPSDIANAIPESIIPSAPTGLTATAGDAKVTLTWNAVAGASGYNISRSLSSTEGFIQINTVLVTTTSFEDTTATNDVKYYYFVKAVDSNGEESLPSTIANATPSSPTLSAPTGLTATAGDAKVTLTWNAVAGATGYNVYRSTTPGSGYTKINTVPINATSYEDAEVSNDETYYYYVKAVKNGVESPAPVEVDAEPKAASPSEEEAESPWLIPAIGIGGVVVLISLLKIILTKLKKTGLEELKPEGDTSMRKPKKKGFYEGAKGKEIKAEKVGAAGEIERVGEAGEAEEIAETEEAEEMGEAEEGAGEEVECSECGNLFGKLAIFCPACGTEFEDKDEDEEDEEDEDEQD
jgi:fibronectin type 3 domain-containing protein